MLVKSEMSWELDGRRLRDGDLVEVRLLVEAETSWIPGVVVCGASVVECQGTADPDAGHHAADLGMNLTLQHVAIQGIGLRHAWKH